MASGQESEGAGSPFRKGPWRDWLETALYVLAVGVFVMGYLFQNLQITTVSMENNLLVGDHLTINKFVVGASDWGLERLLLPLRPIKRGDVLVFKYPGDPRREFIKRCVGLPGDVFEIVDDRVLINGRQLEEPYAYYKVEDNGEEAARRDEYNRFLPLDYETEVPGLDHARERRSQLLPMKEVVARTEVMLEHYVKRDGRYRAALLEQVAGASGKVIPEGFYFLMGDNRNRSSDSRDWGLVPRGLIKGKAYLVWWSYGEQEGSHELRGGELLKSYLSIPITFRSRTRWRESMRRVR